MTATEINETVDDLDGQTVQAGLRSSFVYDIPWQIRLDTDATAFTDKRPAMLSPGAVRELARHLNELADEADLRNLEAEPADVPMACTACGKPVTRSGDTDWVHRDPADINPCAQARHGGPVKARVDA